MPMYSKREMAELAAEYGFQRDTFEKCGNRPVSARQHRAYDDETSQRNCRHRYA